jgi:hypothetical protein
MSPARKFRRKTFMVATMGSIVSMRGLLAFAVFAANRAAWPAEAFEAVAHPLLVQVGQSGATRTLVTSDPICDIFANGYDSPGAGPCASCFDSTINFGETDIDCGGSYCKTCSAGQQCVAGTDCQSGTCTNNVCSGTVLLLISQVRTRGVGGAADEFVELYNPAATDVIFDSSWTLAARSSSASSQTLRYTGAGQSIPAHGHILLGGTGYSESVAADAALTTGITDAGSIVLQHNSIVVDALCFYFDAATQNAIIGFTCEGTPVSNLPHDNTTTGSSNSDVSLERKPGGTLGNTQNTGDNSADFQSATPADPHDLASSPVP